MEKLNNINDNEYLSISSYLKQIHCDDLMLYEIDDYSKVVNKYCKENGEKLKYVESSPLGILYKYPRYILDKSFNEWCYSDSNNIPVIEVKDCEVNFYDALDV